MKKFLILFAAVLSVAMSVDAQIMRTEELETYAKEKYGEKWNDAAANLASTLQLDKNNSLTYVQVIDCPGKTKNQLYVILNYWVTASFNDANSVIQLNDKELGCIIAQGYLPNIAGHMGGTNSYNVSVKPIIKLDIKENKIRVTYLNILEYKPTVEDRTISQEFRDRIKQEDIPDKMKEALLKSTVESITFLNHSENGNFEIPLKLLSKGTMKYVRILNTLYDMVTSSHVYYLDELGEDLHYDLLFYYLNVFLFNSDKSQLIITSQETALLSQDLINDNRGVVWFVEKNKETASSEYSRGDSFGLHKNLSLYNSYRIGRLGAKPELGSIFIDMEN